MQKIIRNINETEQILEIILSAEEFGDVYNQEFEDAKRSIQIKGFRKGHAPASLVKKLVGPSLETTVAEKMASKYFGELADSETVKPINRAEIIGFSFADNQLKIELAYEVHPEFDLKDFSGYSFIKARYTIADSDIEREIKLALQPHGSLVTVDAAATSNDVVIGDVWKLNEDDEPDEAHKTANHHFTLEYLPETNPFRIALIGKKAGESVDVETIDQAADAVPSRFRVVISEIKHLELPELTEELLKEITDQKFQSISEFRSDIQSQLEKHFTKIAEEELLEAISEKLIEENPVPTPESMVISFTNMLFENAKRQLRGQFPSHFDEQEFRESLRENAIKHAQWMIITRKIAETGHISVSEDDIKAYLEVEAENMTSLRKEQVLESYKNPEIREYVAETLFKEKVYAVLKSKVTITEEEKSIPARTEME